MIPDITVQRVRLPSIRAKVENDRGEDNQAVYAGGRRAKDGPQLLRHGFENAVYKIMSAMAYRPFTKLCRR